MQNSHIFQLLKTLSRKEINKLPEFINSPLCSISDVRGNHKTISRQKINLLYDYLKKYYPDFSNRNLNKEAVFAGVFPDEKYNDKKLRNIKHELSKVVEFYISHLCLIHDPFQAKMYLLKRVNTFGNDKLVDNTLHSCESLLEQKDIRDEEYYYQKYLITNKENFT